MTNSVVPFRQPERWVHYSDMATEIGLFSKNPVDETFRCKPRGLWITPEGVVDNWYDWCLAEDFNKGDLNFIHDVAIKPEARLLRLETGADIDAFTEEYAFSVMEEAGLVEQEKDQRSADWMRRQRDAVRWDKVAETYQGILIPNYIWEKRMNPFWYYSWDCASGCIWDVDAIESIKCRSTESAGFVSRKLDLELAMKNLKEATDELRRKRKQDASSEV